MTLGCLWCVNSHLKQGHCLAKAVFNYLMDGPRKTLFKYGLFHLFLLNLTRNSCCLLYNNMFKVLSHFSGEKVCLKKQNGTSSHLTDKSLSHTLQCLKHWEDVKGLYDWYSGQYFVYLLNGKTHIIYKLTGCDSLLMTLFNVCQFTNVWIPM